MFSSLPVKTETQRYSEGSHRDLRTAREWSIVAGRCQLQFQRIEEASGYFSQALTVSPRTQVQKELGWINLEMGQLAFAISLLGDHLVRNLRDHEAYNLLLNCYYLSGNYQAVVDLAAALIDQKAVNSCFKNNWFIARLLLEQYTSSELDAFSANHGASPILTYNLLVARERPASWDSERGPPLKAK